MKRRKKKAKPDLSALPGGVIARQRPRETASMELAIGGRNIRVDWTGSALIVTDLGAA